MAPKLKAVRPLTVDPQIADWTEHMSLDQLIPLISERVTHVEIAWADGACRAELRCGGRRWIGRGPKASVALARAMNVHDLTRGDRDETIEYGGA